MSVRRKGRRWYSLARARRISFLTAWSEWVVAAAGELSSSSSSSSEGGVTRRRWGAGSGEGEGETGEPVGSGSWWVC